ncbi:ABC-type bacteriocin/lantibiotic exporter with N-terminal double-glycine peptidase domain [Pseudomonas asplenii]|nr:ABC-type bacteriocin/lantibiotic exporter with N-terminal double-glycine peptidase domain [Pseudomonas fuscovaginae]
MNHFVVLKKVTGTRLTIHDPAYGIRNMSWTELSRHFTGVALELTPGELFKCSDSPRRTPLLSILGKVDGLYSGATRLLLIGLVLQTVTLITPFYLQWVLDDVLASNDQQLMTLLGVGFLLLMVLQAGLGLLRSWMTSALSTYLSYQWLGNAFSHLLRLPVTWFEKRHLGDITSRFNSLHAIQKALTTQLIEGVIDGVLVITTFFLMLYYSVLLTSICVLAVSIYATLRCCAFRIQKEKTSAHISQIAKQNTLFIESVRSIQSIRLFGR